MSQREVVPFPAHPPAAPAAPVAPVQGMLALDLLPRHDPPADPAGPATPGDVVPIDRRRQRDLHVWIHRFVQAAVEIVGGDRPVTQLLRWTTGEVYEDLSRRAVLVARAGGHTAAAGRVQPVRPRVVGVRTCEVATGTVEAGIHVRYGERSRAVAARFEQTDGRWVCTALDFA